MAKRHSDPQTRLLARLRGLETRLEAYESGVVADIIPTELLAELQALHHMSIHGLRRPDDLGYVKGQAPKSTGTRGGNRAYYQLSLVRKELEGLARRVRSTNEQLDPSSRGSFEAAVEMEQVSESYQTRKAAS